LTVVMTCTAFCLLCCNGLMTLQVMLRNYDVVMMYSSNQKLIDQLMINVFQLID